MLRVAIVFSLLCLGGIIAQRSNPQQIPCKKSGHGCYLHPGNNPAYGICCGRCVPANEDWGFCDGGSRGNGDKARGNGLDQFNGVANAGGQLFRENSGQFSGRNGQQMNSAYEDMNAASNSRLIAAQQQLNDERYAAQQGFSANSQGFNAASNAAANMAHAGQRVYSHHSSSSSNAFSKSEQQKREEKSQNTVRYSTGLKAPINIKGTGSSSGYHTELQFTSEDQ